MNVICRQKHLILSGDPGNGTILIRLRAHKEFPEIMMAKCSPGVKDYPLPKGFNPKKIEGVQFVPAPGSIEIHEEKNDEKN